MKRYLYRYMAKTLPLYRTSRLHFCVGQDLTLMAEQLGIEVELPAGKKPDDYDALTYAAEVWGTHHIVMLLRPLALPGTIAHEAVHAVNHILLRINSQLDLHHDEPQAYLTDWVVSRAWRTVTKPNLKLRKSLTLT